MLVQAIHELGIEPIFVQKSVLYKKCPLEPIFCTTPDRIRRLERTEQAADVIKLSDGTELRLGPTDSLESLLAALDGEQNHWLGELFLQEDLHPDSPVRDHELAGLLKAIEGPEDVS